MAGKKKGNKAKARRTGNRVVKYTQGVPTPRQRNYVSFATTANDLHHVKALTNPFSDFARGAKIPDDDSARSIALQIVDFNSIDVPSTTGGMFAVSVTPSLAASLTKAATMSSTQVLTWGTALPLADSAALTAGLHKYRVVSWGVRIYCTLAPTARSGWMKVITLPERLETPFNFHSGFFEEVKAYPLAEETVHWISKPVGIGWKEYVDPSTTGYPPWENVIIVVGGLPTGAQNGAFCIETVLNIEGLPNIGSISGAAATPAADSKPHVLAAAARTLAKHGGSHMGTSFGGIISNFAEAALRGVVNAVVPGAGALIPRRPVPMIVD